MHPECSADTHLYVAIEPSATTEPPNMVAVKAATPAMPHAALNGSREHIIMVPYYIYIHTCKPHTCSIYIIDF